MLDPQLPLGAFLALQGALEGVAGETIDRLGGMLSAIDAGFVQRAIQDAAYQAQQAIDSGDAVVVGVNRFTSTGALHIETLQIHPAVEREQIDRLRQVRSSRSARDWRAALDAVSRAAASGDNLMPPLVAAVEAKATVGEISDMLRQQFGEYRERV